MPPCFAGGFFRVIIHKNRQGGSLDMINTIGMIGTGNMGSAILRGIVDASYVKASQIIAFDASSRRMNELEEDIPGIQLARDCLEVAEKADLIILAVKPIYVKDVIGEIHSALNGKAVLSIAAGWTVNMLENALYGTSATYLSTMPKGYLILSGKQKYFPNGFLTVLLRSAEAVPLMCT